MCGKLYDKSMDSLKVDMMMIAPCPTLLERHHGPGPCTGTTRTPAEIEEERQRRRKGLEALREQRLKEENSYRAEERRRQDQSEANEERARRLRADLDRQLRVEATFCKALPCFVV